MKYFIITFGCQMNKSDAERIVSVLKEMNYKATSEMEKADLIVAVACSVRQTAVDRIYGLIPKFKKLKKHHQTILTGCVAKKDQKKLEKSFDLKREKYKI